MAEEESGLTAEAEAPASGGEQQSGESAPSFRSPLDIYTDDGVDEARLESIPDDYKATKSFLAKYPSAKELDKAISNVGYLARSKGFERPPPDAPPEEIARYNETLRKALDVPEGPEGYGIEKPESMTDEEWEGLNISEYLEVARENNVSPQAMKALWDLDQARVAKQSEAAKAAQDSYVKEQTDILVQEFGGNLETVKQNANEVADLVGLPREEITSASLVKALSNMHQYIGESQLPNSNEGSSRDLGKSLDQQMEAVMTDPSNPFYNDFKSEDPSRVRRATDEIARLSKLKAHARTKGAA